MMRALSPELRFWPSGGVTGEAGRWLGLRRLPAPPCARGYWFRPTAPPPEGTPDKQNTSSPA